MLGYVHRRTTDHDPALDTKFAISVTSVISCGHYVFGINESCKNNSVIFLLTEMVLELINDFCNYFCGDGTLCQVWRPAVKELAPLQQAPGSLSLKISQEVEIVPGCAVKVSFVPYPFIAPVPLGPGRDVRNMMGWSLVETTARSGVWWFGGALKGENVMSSLCAAGDWVKKGSCHTAWSVPLLSSCSCSYAYGHGTAVGPQTGERCWTLLVKLWSAIAPLMKPWCAVREVSSAANLNL